MGDPLIKIIIFQKKYSKTNIKTIQSYEQKNDRTTNDRADR